MQSFDITRFDIGHYVSVAAGYLKTGNPEKAAEVAVRGLTEYPEQVDLLLLLGKSRYFTGAWAPGLEALEQAAAIAPLSAVARLALAECYLGLGQLEPAQCELKFLCERGKSTAELWPGLADALYRSGLHRRAAKVWNRLRKGDPTNADAHYRYALCLHELGADPEDLFEPLHEAAMLRPDVPGYRVRLAEAWAQLEEFSEAVEELAELDLEAIECECCLQRGARLYLAAGLEDQAALWLARRAALGEGKQTSPEENRS